MAWNHKGVEIELRGERFFAEIGGKRVFLSSLNGVKKAIDKHLDAQAQTVVLNVPVVMRISPPYRYSETSSSDQIVRSVITGMDQEEMCVTGLDVPKGWSINAVLHDTPANAKKLARQIAAEQEKKAADAAMKGREIGQSFRGKYGKPSNTYGEAVALFQQSCEKAKKGESLD